jgi:AraC-like DNA-binding protein
VEDKEYLVLQLSPADPAPEYAKAISLLAGYKRQLTVAGPPVHPEDLAGLRKQLADQLDRVCRTALTQHVDALVHAIALRQPDECAALCVKLEQFCADCGAAAAQRARRQLVSACSGFFTDKENAMQAFLAAQDEDFQTLCLLAIRLLAPAQERVSDAMARYALERQSERVTLNAVAAALKYNATYLGRKFLEEQGLGFREWLLQQRIARGAELLRGTELSVSAIAKAVGYEHYKRFLRHFKQRYGMTPELYRHKKP